MGQNLGKVGICPMGDYASGKSYERLSSVFYNHEYWVAVKDVPVGAVPSATSEYWQKMASRGEQGPQGQSYVDKELVPIVDNLTTGGSSNVLSAEQGKVLKAELTELESEAGVFRNILLYNNHIKGYITDVGTSKPITIVGTDAYKCVLIKVTEGQTFKYILNSGGTKRRLVAFINKELSAKVGDNIECIKGVNTLITPQGADYLGITTKFGDDDVDTNLELYATPGLYDKILDLNDRLKGVSETFENFKESLFTKSVNLFDGNTLNGYWTTVGFIENSRFFASAPIKVESAKEYKYPCDKSTFGANSLIIALYDSSMALKNIALAIDNGDGYAIVTVEEGVSYVSVNVGKKESLDTFMFCQTELYPSEYIPYQILLDETIKVPSSSIIGGIVGGDNVLEGKIITFNGDSICEGLGSGGGYGKIIAERNNMIYENIGVSGGTITAEQYREGNRARHWISRTIDLMRQDADYIILEGGVNDSSLQVPLGAITSGYKSALDDTTFCGAMESVLSQAIERFKGKKIGFIVVHKMTDTYNSEVKDYEYYSKTIQICQKWGIPFIDLNTTCPPLGYISSLRNEYTNNADGWHPNEDGYKRYYCDKIESWMKTL